MSYLKKSYPKKSYPNQFSLRRLQSIGCSIGVALALTTIATTLAPVAIAAPKGWVKVLTENGKTWYVDNGSIQGTGRFRYFWSYIVNQTPYVEAGKSVYGTAFYLSVDCQQKRFRLRFAKLLDANNNTVRDINYGEQKPLGTIDTGTGEAVSANYVCSRR